MSVTAAERQEAHRLATEEVRKFARSSSVHRRASSSARPRAVVRAVPRAPEKPPEPKRPPETEFAAALLATIPWWRFGERSVARRLAKQQADDAYRLSLDNHRAVLAEHARRLEAHQATLQRLVDERDAEDRLLDRAHKRLTAGHRDASRRAIAAVLGELPAEAQLVGWHGDVALVAIRAPRLEIVPEREPTFTSTGKPSTRKLNQGERNDLLAEFVASVCLAAAHRAAAAAPGVTAVVAAAVDSQRALLGYCEAGRKRVKLSDDPVSALYDADGDLRQAGRTRKLEPLDLNERTDLHALAAAS